MGDGPARPALEERAAALGLAAPAAVFAGMAAPEEVPLYYRLGDVFVSASSSETQGLTYLEALSYGVPALSRRDECLEGIIRDGLNGWQYQDSAQFRKHLQKLMEAPALGVQMGRCAAELAQQSFSYQAFASRVAAVYEQVLGVHPRSAGAA